MLSTDRFDVISKDRAHISCATRLFIVDSANYIDHERLNLIRGKSNRRAREWEGPIWQAGHVIHPIDLDDMATR